MNFGLILPRELHSPFDRRSFPNYAMIAALTVCGLFGLLALDFRIAPVILSEFFSWGLMAIISGMAARRFGWGRLGGALESIGVIYWQGLAGFFCIVPLAAISLPLADQTLSNMDRFLGFDWNAYALLTEPLRSPFVLAYKSFLWQPAVVLIALFATGRADRGWQLVQAATIALIVTILFFPLLPAIGSYQFYGEQPSYLYPVAANSSRVLLELKGGVRVLDASSFAGMLTFPSYHAAAAILFAWAAWPIGMLRWPMVALNVLVLAATITIGSHYLVDIFAGCVLAAAAISASKGLQRWQHERPTNQRGNLGQP